MLRTILTCAILATLTEALHISGLHEHQSSLDVVAGESAVPAQDDGVLTKVFSICVIMYGGLAIVWLLTRVLGVESSGRLQVVILMVSWASTSVGMHILNKTLVTSLDSPALISAAQMVLAAAAFAPRCIPELWAAPSSQVWRWCVVPIFFAAMLTTSFYAYEYMSLTLLTIVRNLSPLVALPIESLLMPPEKRPNISMQVVISILIMLVGAMAYGGTNFESISMIGIGFAVLNMVVAISDRMIQRRLLTTECRDLSAGACTLINNSLGLLPTLMLAQLSGQISEARTPEHAANWQDPKVMLLLLVSGLVGIGISWLGLECQRVISATSFIVMQNASKVFVIGAGVAVFGDPISSTASALGLLTSLIGSWLYGAAQMQGAEKTVASKGEGEKKLLSAGARDSTTSVAGDKSV